MSTTAPDLRLDDDGVFERLSLEGFQAGLRWATIPRKREAFSRVLPQVQHRRVR